MSKEQEEEILLALDEVFNPETESEENLLSLLAELPYRPSGQMMWYLPTSPDPIACSQ